MLRESLSIVGIVAVASSAWAQSGNTNQSTLVTKLHPPQIFEAIEDVHYGVTDCLQDETGFLWIAADSTGLSRWDGHSIRSYKRSIDDEADVEAKMLSAFATDLALAPGGKLWIGTGDAGASVLDLASDTFTHFQANEEDEASLSGNGVNQVFIDSTGNVWMATSDGVLNRYIPETKNFQHIRDFEDLETEVLAIAEDKDKMFWIGTSTQGLFKYDPAKSSVIDRFVTGEGRGSLSHNKVRVLMIDKDDVLWVGTENGLNKFNAKDGTFKHYFNRNNDRFSLADNRIREMFQDQDGVLWFGTEVGLSEMTADDTFIQYVRDADEPATSTFPRRITCATQDRGGVLYFSDATSYLYRVTPGRRAFNPHIATSHITEGTAMTNGKNGTVWLGTVGQGVIKYDFENRRVTQYPIVGEPGSPDSVTLQEWILAVHEDQRERKTVLWIGGQGIGLIRFEPNTGEFEQFLYKEDQLEGPTSNSIQDIAQSKDGTIWMATFGGGLNKYVVKTRAFVDFMEEPGDPATISSNYLYVLRFDKKDPNVLWIGTNGGGLNRFHTKKERFTRYNLAPETTVEQDEEAQSSTATRYDTIQTIHQDDDGMLWLGMDNGGLIRFDPSDGGKRYFSEKDGLSHPTIYGIVPGEGRDLWMTTNGGGVVRFNPEAPDGEMFDVYTKADGITDITFNQNGYLRRSDGTLMMAAGPGLHIFNPKDIKPYEFKPKVALTSFKKFNKEAKLDVPIWSQPKIYLGYTDSVISFEFAALSFAAPENNLYQYKMDGLHDWIETKRRFVTYPNIEGGDYTFRVKAANHRGEWGNEDIAVKISVDQPPWKTWWAYTIYGLILIGLILAYLRYQARKVQALQDAHRLETVEHELELTGAVQVGFLPKTDNIHGPPFSLQGYYRPADRASGDWWWYEEQGELLTVLIGDVTGHGPGPAMVTAAAATAFRIQENVPLKERLLVLNEEVLRVGVGAYQMTMTAIEIDGRTGRFTFYSAGGQPIMRLRNEGKPRLLPCPGTPLGTEQFNLGHVEGTMVPGERLMLYTDGIPELELENGRLLGMRRFSMLCERTRGLSVERAVSQIVEAADTLRQGRPQDDDWTFSIVAWHGVGG